MTRIASALRRLADWLDPRRGLEPIGPSPLFDRDALDRIVREWRIGCEKRRQSSNVRA